MGVVKISDELYETAKRTARTMNRSINSQAEYWMRIGKFMEDNPTLIFPEILKILVSEVYTGEIQTPN